VNTLNLFQSVRDLLFPALMMAAVFLGTFATSAKADVYSPNGVLLSSAQWDEQSTDGKKVTVREALTNSENTMITNGVKGVDNYTLTVLSFWDGSSNGDHLSVQVRQSGSPQATCRVSSAKDGDKYDTTCTKQ